MAYLTLTKSSFPIIGQLSWLLGIFMDWIFNFCHMIGLPNIGLSIILFTIITKILLLPLSIKQQKSVQLNSVMAPELRAIQAKYKGKRDQESMIRMQDETSQVYQKYGSKQTSGCFTMLIQMLIIFALYNVIYNIPAYVPSVRHYYDNIVNGLRGISDYASNADLITLAKANRITKVADLNNVNRLVDMMYNFDPIEWGTFKHIFPSIQALVDTNVKEISRLNSFLGMDLSTSPLHQLWPAVFIPILAGITQWYSSKLSMMGSQQAMGDENPAGNSMKMMNNIMPLVSVFFCFTFATGIGVYWVASSAIQIVIQLFVNDYMKKVDVNEMVKENIRKANEKRQAKGLPPMKVSKNPVIDAQSIAEQRKREEEEAEKKKASRESRLKESTQYYKDTAKAKEGSLASKARMVEQYNERNRKN